MYTIRRAERQIWELISVTSLSGKSWPLLCHVNTILVRSQVRVLQIASLGIFRRRHQNGNPKDDNPSNEQLLQLVRVSRKFSPRMQYKELQRVWPEMSGMNRYIDRKLRANYVSILDVADRRRPIEEAACSGQWGQEVDGGWRQGFECLPTRGTEL